MKLLFIPLQTSTPETDDFYLSLCKKCTVQFYHSVDESIAFQPDIVYVHSGAVALDLLKIIKKATNALWTQWTGDCIEDTLLEPVISHKELFDITFLSVGVGQKEMYEKELKHPVKWMPHGVADWQFREVNENAKGVVMAAHNYSHFSGSAERVDLVEKLNLRGNFKLYGNGWGDHIKPSAWMDNPDIFNKAFINIGGNNINNVALYFSNRPTNAMAAGSCFFMRHVPQIETIFTDVEDCIIYKTNDEAIERMTISREERNRIARNGQKKVRDLFHYDVIAEKYLEVCTRQ